MCKEEEKGKCRETEIEKKKEGGRLSRSRNSVLLLEERSRINSYIFNHIYPEADGVFNKRLVRRQLLRLTTLLGEVGITVSLIAIMKFRYELGFRCERVIALTEIHAYPTPRRDLTKYIMLHDASVIADKHINAKCPRILYNVSVG